MICAREGTKKNLQLERFFLVSFTPDSRSPQDQSLVLLILIIPEPLLEIFPVRFNGSIIRGSRSCLRPNEGNMACRTRSILLQHPTKSPEDHGIQHILCTVRHIEVHNIILASAHADLILLHHAGNVTVRLHRCPSRIQR